MKHSRPTILVVDDMPSNIRTVCSILSDEYAMVFAMSGEEALEIARKQSPDLILLDIEMPGMDGYEVCRQLKQGEETHLIPVLFLTARDRLEHVLQGFEVGAVDFIHKPFEPAILKARVKSQIQSVYYQKLKERERLLEEMHDGFGSQLMSARLMVMNGDYTQERLVALMGECIDDLHLVVDLYGHRETTLEEALAQYRYRLKNRIAGMEVDLQWELALEECPAYSEHQILQLLRIVQEGINNALKHAEAEQIRITAHCNHDQQLVIVVEDDGLGLPETVKKNRGIGNMEKRATSIGACFSIANGVRGTEARITL